MGLKRMCMMDSAAHAAVSETHGIPHVPVDTGGGWQLHLARQMKRALNLPFASPNAFVRVQSELPEARMVMTIAQDHHRCVVRAIENREGTRAEAIMREHARLAMRNLEFALRNQRTRNLVPGSVLIRTLVAATATI